MAPNKGVPMGLIKKIKQLQEDRAFKALNNEIEEVQKETDAMVKAGTLRFLRCPNSTTIIRYLIKNNKGSARAGRCACWEQHDPNSLATATSEEYKNQP
jgi:hypothetical protein